ncbi:MAG: beta-glucosidase, partial [Phycisphaeraceae bacterium]|nr:beta-glucosidase [Phycisphaeraceae bacterium]
MFREGFVWGAGSSSYQIEGAVAQDGRLPSIWDTFCTRPGAIQNAESGETSCDHYNRMTDDVALMGRIGLQAYRFSIAWPRVLPLGMGKVNEPGLAFYDRLVDSLLQAGIEPWATLYHWDLPQALFDRGGWLSPEIPAWFAEYTRVVVNRLGDRVKHWITINEPQIFIGLGYREGKHPPGLKLSMSEQLTAAHNVLLAHGRAVQVIRERSKAPAQVGWAPVGRVDYPITETPEEIEAARRCSFSITEKGFWNNTWFGDPACLGHYPEDGVKLFGKDMPRIQKGDMETIHQPLDFYGVNIYSGAPVKAGGAADAQPVPWAPGTASTTMRWPVAPKSLYWGPRFLHERYKLPIVITENGMANIDWVAGDGRVHDPQRIDFTRSYLLELARAHTHGVPVAGYFHWAILDNFELAEGYKERFGLIYVDFATQKRTLKDSAYWYAEVIRTNGDHLSDASPFAAASGATSTATPGRKDVIVSTPGARKPAAIPGG